MKTRNILLPILLIAISIVFATPLLAAVPKLQVAIGEIQFISDNGIGPEPALSALVENARDVFNQLYGSQVDLLPNGKSPGKAPTVSIKAIEASGSLMVTFSIVAGSQEFNKVFSYSFRKMEAKTVASAIFYLVNQVDGFSRFMGQAPVLIDRMDVSQVQAPGATYSMMPYSASVRPNGNLVLGMIGIIAELDPNGKVVDYWGKSLMAEQNFSFAYDVKVSPSGTVFSKSGNTPEVYAFSMSQDPPRKINSQLEQAFNFAVLDDGSFVIKDATSAKMLRFEGRKKSELSIIDPTYPWVQFAAGPDSTIRVLDIQASEIRGFDKSGMLLEKIMLMAPPEIIQGTQRFICCPDGSMIFQGYDFLARIDRNGVPVWFVNKVTHPELADNQTVMSLAFDPLSASIYLVKMTTKEIIRIQDLSWAAEHKIDTKIFAPLVKANVILTKDADDWDALLAKADWYEKAGAGDIALAAMSRLNGIDPGDREVATRLKDLKVAKFLSSAEASKDRVLTTMRTIGPESARVDYIFTLKLYEQVLALDPANKVAAKSRNELIAAMKQAEQTPLELQVPPLTIVSAKITNLFPALSATYRTSPMGLLTLQNDSASDAKGISVSIFIPRFMDFPTDLPGTTLLKAGQKLDIPLTAAFNQATLLVEEDLPIQAQLNLKWEYAGQTQTMQKSIPTTLYRRTALSWDNSGKLASFMTPNEESVNSFALRCLDQSKGMASQEIGLGSFSLKVWRAAVIANALGSYGIAYLEDPQSPISKTLGKAEAVDTVRFPRTTLYYKSGDCDDSSALLASLFEAAGIQTAIMTSPGHVFIAFDTGEPLENAWIFGDAKNGNIIIKNKSIWLPVETTDIKNGFLHAWQSAAKLVSQYQGSPDLEMIPVHEQWQVFPSIPLPQSPYQIILPSSPSQKTVLQKDASGLLTALYDKTVSAAQAQLPASGKQRLSQLNRIGILHARFGNASQATAAFQQAMKEDKTHLAAYLNLSSLYLQGGKTSEALGILQQAKSIRPESSSVQLMMAQAYYAIGDTTKTQEAYLALQSESKELAAQYSWLSKTTGDASQKDGVERASNAASPIKAFWTDSE